MRKVQSNFTFSTFFFFLFQDLLKHTPSSHPDYPLLQDALRISQNFLSSINEEITPRRQSMMVKKGEVSVETEQHHDILEIMKDKMTFHSYLFLLTLSWCLARLLPVHKGDVICWFITKINSINFCLLECGLHHCC